MSRIYGACIEIFAAAIFLIPIFCIYHKCIFHSGKKTLLNLIFACYLVAMWSLVGLPNVLYMRLQFRFNFIPFVRMLAEYKNTLLNVILFIPLGIFLPILYPKYRSMKHTLLVGAYTTLTIEIAQIFTFRATDINDIIVNIVGTFIGYFFAKFITKNFTRFTNWSIQNEKNTNVTSDTKNIEIYLVFGTVILIMFFAQPFISTLFMAIFILILN